MVDFVRRIEDAISYLRILISVAVGKTETPPVRDLKHPQRHPEDRVRPLEGGVYT